MSKIETMNNSIAENNYALLPESPAYRKINYSGYLLCLIFFLLCNHVLLAQRTIPCSPWIKTVEEYYQRGRRVPLGPQHMKLRKAILSIDSIVKRNAAFGSITPARFRTSLVLTGDDLQSVQLNIKAYSKDGWDDKCGIIPQADRISADDAGICMTINRTGAHYTALEISATKDEKLEAFREPVITRTIAGYPMYYESKANHFLMITLHGEVPWEAVTMEEYMAFIERTLLKKIENAEQENKLHPISKMQEPKSSLYYLELKKTDPKSAAEWLQLMEKSKIEYEASSKEADKLILEGVKSLKNDLEEFRVLRAAYTSADLKKQAIRGHSKFGLYSDQYPMVRDPLVKIKPGFFADTKSKSGIKIITIWAAGTYLDWDDHIQQALETLDYNAIINLMK
jgi:hypothetical protein